MVVQVFRVLLYGCVDVQVVARELLCGRLCVQVVAM